MERIIEFPRPKAPEKESEFPKTASKKVINIADWTRNQQGQRVSTTADNWPFCAA
jgi:hypothetical protein